MSDSQTQSSSQNKVTNVSQELNNAFISSPSQIQQTPSTKNYRKKQKKNNKKKIKWQNSSDSDSQLKQLIKLSHQAQKQALQTPFKSNQSTQSLRISKTADVKTKSGNKFQNICSICLGQFKDIRGSLQCKHQFCFQCIQQWCKTSSICPCCRKQVGFIHKISKSKQSNYISEIQKINVEKKQFAVQSQYDHYTCYQCGLGDDENLLLICDECDFYCCHVYCDPDLGFQIPQGNWYCIYCAATIRNRQNSRETSNNRRNNYNPRQIVPLDQENQTQQSNKSIGVAMRTRSRQPQPVRQLNLRTFRNIRRRR